MYDVIVIGGGLAGLTSAILLGQEGYKVLLLEKNVFPFHRVCGEYISNEVIPFMDHHQIYPRALHPSEIRRFSLTDLAGRKTNMALDLGGFGISRYALDQFLFTVAAERGVECRDGTRVESLQFKEGNFQVDSLNESFRARIVIGAHGKRSRLDKKLNRPFMHKRSPYIGVKYHISNAPHHVDEVALHNFSGGYCGINAIENGLFNLCYLSHRDNLRVHGSIDALESKVLFKNPVIRKLFQESDFQWETPLVINEVSFATKEPVIDHVLTCGDAAGMITPLCGNGMAMAIHGAKILTDCIRKYSSSGKVEREALELEYSKQWRKTFALRLSTGRTVQRLFGSNYMAQLTVSIGLHIPPLARLIMKNTHGKPFLP